MKPRPFLLKFRHSSKSFPAMAFCLVATLATAPAADLFWDGADTGADAQGGTGTWLNGITSNWDTLATGGTDTVWANANLDNANFGGTAGTVTLGSDVTASKLGFTTANYVIEPGASPYKIVLGAAGDNTTNNQTVQNIYGNNTKTINANIDNAGFLFVVGNGTTNLNGVISGSGGLSKVGGGTLTLSDNNTYTGKTFIEANQVSGSTVNVSSFNSVVGGTASSSLGAPTTVADGTIQLGIGTKQASMTLNYQGASATGETTDRVIDILFNGSASQRINASGSGLLKFTSAMTTNATAARPGAFIIGGTGSGEISSLPTLANTGGLRKLDAGTWTLGNGTVSKLTVEGGKLLVNGTMNVTTTVDVSSGATLGGSGTVGGDITVNNDGTLAPGNSAGQFTVGKTLTLAATSNTVMELGGTTLGASYDNISLDALATALTYGGNLSVANMGLFDMDLASFTYDLFDLKSVIAAGSFASVTVNSILLSNSGGLWTGSNGDVDYSFAQSTGDLTISVVPEPSAALLGGLGLLVLLRRRR